MGIIVEDIVNRVMESLQTDLSKARIGTNTRPSDNQKKAGNYKKGKVRVNGFLITIENPKGTYRSGKDRDGKEWKCLMHHDYGYFNRTVGKDGDAIDVFIGDDLNSKKIFAIDQKVKGKFDETKIMFCFPSESAARQGYLSNYEKDWKGLWKITETDIDTFKKWLYDGYRQRKPFSQYKSLTESKQTNTPMLTKLTGKQFKKVITESVKDVRNQMLFEDYESIYEYYTEILDKYANQVKDGQPLSPDQIAQVEEIRDYFVDHDANDNYYLPSWIKIADNLAKGLPAI